MGDCVDYNKKTFILYKSHIGGNVFRTEEMLMDRFEFELLSSMAEQQERSLRKETFGFSGAQLESVANEAPIYALRDVSRVI